MPGVALQNLGCSKNLIDGERILGFFRSSGFEPVQDMREAEIIIVNTCAFIREAQEEAIETILESASYKKEGKCRTLVVTGCFSQRYREEVADRFPEVNLWAGVDDWEKVLTEHFAGGKVVSFERELMEPLSTQYIKIAEGCSHKCSFCAIPSIRGPFKSRSPQSIIEEAVWLYSKGARELILVAQDTSFYGRESGFTLTALLEELLKKTSFHWIRMMYLHPQFVDDSLLKLVASEKRICPYFDIPLQHISDPILKSMHRSPLSAGIYKLIERIRSIVPDAALRSSFILGYPGEKENHFNELRKFIEFARFDKLGVFPFSPEHGTSAYNMKGRPRTSTVQKRCEELMLLQREISREIMESKIGTSIEVIVDSVSEDPDYNFEARSRSDAPEIDGKVFISSGSYAPGTFVKVKVFGAGDYDLFAESLDKGCDCL